MTDAKFILDVLELYAQYDIQGDLWWNFDGAGVHFYVPCSDLFWWATADSEPLTPASLPKLRQAIEDCREIDPVDGESSGLELYCCRMRQMRPQGCCYPQKELWPLFDAVGPEREIGLGNPFKPGERDNDE